MVGQLPTPAASYACRLWWTRFLKRRSGHVVHFTIPVSLSLKNRLVAHWRNDSGAASASCSILSSSLSSSSTLDPFPPSRAVISSHIVLYLLIHMICSFLTVIEIRWIQLVLDFEMFSNVFFILSRNTNKMQLCNRMYCSKVYWRLNMFRAAHRLSSGALNCICSLWFIYLCGDRPMPRLNGKCLFVFFQILFHLFYRLSSCILLFVLRISIQRL